MTAGSDLLQERRPLVGRQAAGQFRAADPAGREQSLQRLGMLPGQNLRRGHEHRLIAVRHGQQHRIDGHDGLAAAHVALQQAVHGQGLAHVAGDLGNRLLLPGRQLEGQEPADAGVDLRGGLQGRRLPQLVLPVAADGHRQPQEEKLLVDQPSPGRLQGIAVVGKVQLRQRPSQWP
jgi:hypothetical protein